MKDTTGLSDGEFHHDLLELVHREFGLGGLARFMRIYGNAQGDYTRDRHVWLDGISLEEITERSSAQHNQAA